MKRADRLSRTLDLLAHKGRVSVEETASELGVSPATVRRDFEDLAAQQLLTRTHGGAISNGTAYDLPMRYRTARHAADKKRIAEAAAGLVTQGMIVGLNGGTTTTGVARRLSMCQELTTGDDPGLTVVTNALNIANELTVRGRVKIVVTGGVARPQSYELIGPLANATLSAISLDVVFLGVDALDPREGAAAHHEGEASVNRHLTERAQRTVVVTDSSKLGRRAFARICKPEEIDVLITDTEAPDDLVAPLQDAGVDVRRV